MQASNEQEGPRETVVSQREGAPRCAPFFAAAAPAHVLQASPAPSRAGTLSCDGLANIVLQILLQFWKTSPHCEISNICAEHFTL